MTRRLAAVLAALVAGCGGSAIPPPATANDPGYPPPPYGYAPMEILPDLLFAGKTIPFGSTAASVPEQMISLGSLRPGARYFVIAASAEWCSDCMGDQPEMVQLELDYSPRGVVGVEILDEAALDVPPTPADLDRWSDEWKLTGTIVRDDRKSFEHAANVIGFPVYYIVDAATMQIVLRSFQPLVARPLGPALDSLLAQ